MSLFAKAFAAPAVLAVASLAAMPAEAAVLPVASHQPANVSHYGGASIRIGGGWGWGGGYRGRHRRGVDAGDVLAGVLILGTIAAVANAANKANQRPRPYPERYPYPDRPNDDRRYDDRRYDDPRSGPQGLEGAADLCLREVERNARAREVTRVERSAEGWLVTGAMVDGSGFSCSIGTDGRIESVDVDGRAQTYGAEAAGTTEDRQYDDNRYRTARADADVRAGRATNSDQRPAYPGGPLPGDEVDGDSSPDG
jgi:hypothetical protein